jgi:hypothetical protein
MINWGRSVGPETGTLVERILETRPHPEQGYRSCLGLMGLGRRFGNDRLEAASKRALDCKTATYRSVKSIIEHGLDRIPTDETETQLTLPVDHAHVRGNQYYSTITTSEETETHATTTDH